jgi:hypothetical protein
MDCQRGGKWTAGVVNPCIAGVSFRPRGKELDCIRSRGQQWARGKLPVTCECAKMIRVLPFGRSVLSIAHVRGGCSVLTWLAKVAENSAGWRTCRVSVTYLLA